MPPPIPLPVRRLGYVSLLTDASSEMVFPLLPRFLTETLRAGPAFLGLVEGLAEATASLLRLASGTLADQVPRRKPLVVAGYGLASVARPLLALATAPVHVLVLRLTDRAGKGVRGAPRDALIAEATPAAARGRAYGLHRALDHSGAAIGPLLAAAVLWGGGAERTVFALAALPALASLAVLVLGVHEPARSSAAAARRPDAGAVPARLPRSLRLYLAAVAVFTLGNSSDAFLLLRAEQAGVASAALPLLWGFHQLAKAALATPGGALSDRIDRRAAIRWGWLAFAASYLGLAFATRPLHVWGLFGLYALHHALSEGAEKALVVDLAPEGARGRAFGLYHAISGATLLPASLLTGALWQRFGARAALLTGGALAAAAAAALAKLPTGSVRSAAR